MPFYDLLLYEQLLLPYFPAAGLSDIARIAEEETDSFIIFNKHLRKGMADIRQAPSVDNVREIIDGLQAGAASLAIEARTISESKLLRGAKVAFFAVSLSMILITHGPHFQPNWRE